MNVFTSADILLPKNVDMTKWAVIACDQFTSDPAYWQRVRTNVGDNASTIHLILPEAELSDDRRTAVNTINKTMTEYCEKDVFICYKNAYIYVERTLENGSIRPGMVGLVDLEAYDYIPGSVSPVRATEKTVLERIPPRKEIRKDAPLEFPHVLMLCDDHDKCLIEPIAAIKSQLPLVYDFDLMEGGGHIRGWLLQGDAAKAFDDRFRLYSSTYEEKYTGLSGAKVLLAVGDGNHSLATAKSCYEELKKLHPAEDLSAHPARYALVELENIHDVSQVFEPIHRIVMNTNPQALIDYLKKYCAEDGFPVEFCAGEYKGLLKLDRTLGELAVAVLQELLDSYLAANSGEIDYIHGEKELNALASGEGCVGFLLPGMEKRQLFRGVIDRGVLPRKTFSMGHAREKRYYLEGRAIR